MTRWASGNDRKASRKGEYKRSKADLGSAYPVAIMVIATSNSITTITALRLPARRSAHPSSRQALPRQVICQFARWLEFGATERTAHTVHNEHQRSAAAKGYVGQSITASSSASLILSVWHLLLLRRSVRLSVRTQYENSQRAGCNQEWHDFQHFDVPHVEVVLRSCKTITCDWPR